MRAPAVSMAVIIRDNRNDWDRFIRSLQRIATEPKSVVTGVQEGSVKDGLSVAEYAATNEFGAVIQRATSKGPSRTVIPSRPFMRLYFDNNEPALHRFSQNAITQAVLGRVTMTQALTAIGLKTQDGIRKQIRKSGDYVPNAPATIKEKGSDKPLIDDAILLGSISFELRRN